MKYWPDINAFPPNDPNQAVVVPGSSGANIYEYRQLRTAREQRETNWIARAPSTPRVIGSWSALQLPDHAENSLTADDTTKSPIHQHTLSNLGFHRKEHRF